MPALRARTSTAIGLALQLRAYGVRVPLHADTVRGAHQNPRAWRRGGKDVQGRPSSPRSVLRRLLHDPSNWGAAR
eukprot:CAMPEP_0172158018 /NCGR_PEP_ID=MMETSP1050-20130122/4133_1 /TAXON_ID=233186 /ORGANISM="Cryptomonas curvata, Strain CCAP979/52" /LENGTH=74 /DNA_ID=CAMNT_0012827351 /DNA_START=265 /DNA_END=490 /DNA_ORIENTATION=+